MFASIAAAAPGGGVGRKGVDVSTIRNILVALTAMLLGACATLDSARAPDADLKNLRSFYVVHLSGEEGGIDKLIAARLIALGYTAAAGDTPEPPEHVDAVITYVDRWWWDITPYLLKLEMQLHDGTSGAVVARAQSTRPSLQRKSPENMVKEVVGELLK
jgi:hypothetical protein